MIGVDGTGLQRRIIVLADKKAVVRNAQLLTDQDRTALCNALSAFQLLKAPHGYPGLPCQLRHTDTALFHPLVEIDLGQRHAASPDTLLLKVGIERGDMAGLQVLQLDMADGPIDYSHLLFISEGGSFLQVGPSILLQKDLRKIHQPDVAVLGHLMPHPLLEERGLPVQGLLDLALGHARLRRPGHLLPDLLAADIISIGHSDPVAVPPFFNCGHNLIKPLFPFLPTPLFLW